MNWDYIRAGRDLDIVFEKARTARTRFLVWVVKQLPTRYRDYDFWFPYNVYVELDRLEAKDTPRRLAHFKSYVAKIHQDNQIAASGIRLVRKILDNFEKEGYSVSSEDRRRAYEQFHPNVVNPPEVLHNSTWGWSE